MYCLRCLYPLLHLDARRCPECGRAFDPHDAGTFSAWPRQRLTQRVAIPMRVFTVLVIAAGLVLALGPWQATVWPNVRGGFVAFGGCLFAEASLTLAEYPTLRSRGIGRWCLGMDAANIVGWLAALALPLIV